MISFIKKLFGKKDEHVIKVNLDYDPNSTHTFKRAKQGSFDESLFINPKTGKFQFPKYKNNKDCLIKIKDCTDYKEDIWDSLEPDEKRSFNIRDFEFHLSSADFEIESFWELFNKSSAKHLKPYDFLKGRGEELNHLLDELDDMRKDNESFIIVDDDLKEELLKAGCFKKHELNDGELETFKHDILENTSVKELKALCSQNNLKSTLTKKELIPQILDNNIVFDLPVPVEPTDKMHDMMKIFHNLYIDDIKKNIQGWHPLYINSIWDAVSMYAECNEVEKLTDEIQKSKYWEEHLYDETI